MKKYTFFPIFTRCRAADNGFADRKDIYFVGGYQHPPNIDAACWFVNDIWPLIHEQLPEMRFHLIGSKAPDRVRALSGDGVVFHGFVEIAANPFSVTADWQWRPCATARV